MTKTLHITNAYHATSGGIRTFYGALLEAAPRHQRLIRLVVPAERSAIEDVNPCARIYHVAAPRSPIIDSRYRLLLPHRFALGRGEIPEILRSERPDLIEVCDKYSLCYLGGLVRSGWLAGTPRPAVVGLSCERMDDNVGTFISRGRVARRFVAWYMDRVYARMFDSHITISQYTRQEIAIRTRPVYVLPMGLNARQFMQAERSGLARRDCFGRFVSPRGTAILLYVGRLSGEKNLALLIDTLEALAKQRERAYHLCVVGDGPLRAWMRDEGDRRAPGRVHFVGHVADRARLARLYANADVFVHPNPREPLGLAPLEAMAAGLPLVAPDSGGVLEYAAPTNAWLAPPDAGSFANAVAEVFASAEARAAKVQRARTAAARHDWTVVAAKYFELYDEIRSNHQGAA